MRHLLSFFISSLSYPTFYQMSIELAVFQILTEAFTRPRYSSHHMTVSEIDSANERAVYPRRVLALAELIAELLASVSME
jgi:hypothetical protein